MSFSLDRNGDLLLPHPVHRQLIAEAAAAHPHECCGLILGRDGRIERVQPARNVHPAPQRNFEIDPAALIAAHRAARSGGAEVLGYYHSHPAGEPRPSDTDRACSAGDGRIWAIIADTKVRMWGDTPAGFIALSYTLDGE